MLTFVTSINKKYWDEGSRTNIASWLKFFPKDCQILIFEENRIPDKFNDPRLKWLDLNKECPELLTFAERYKDNPHYNGEKTKKLREKFRWNAIKFAHKTFPLFRAKEIVGKGQLIWLDADVLAIRPLTPVFVGKMCPPSKAVSYLGRPSTWSECGFVYYNLNIQEGHDFLDMFKEYYTVDGMLDDLRETHDSFVFDQVRVNFPQEKQNMLLDINAHSQTNKHPFHESLLRECLTHHKGSNKTRKQLKFLKRYNLNELRY